MYVLTPFSQNALLHGVTDPDLRAGVCRAACDAWLREIKADPTLPPAGRLAALTRRQNDILSYQSQYNRRRGNQPEEAHAAMGQSIGLDLEHQTTIMSRSHTLAQMVSVLVTDLRLIGAAATWSMRFADAVGNETGGHAIAGFHNIVAITNTMARRQFHVFDPNQGEYVGETGDLEPILTTALNSFPSLLVASVRRVWVG